MCEEASVITDGVVSAAGASGAAAEGDVPTHAGAAAAGGEAPPQDGGGARHGETQTHGLHQQE